MAKNRKLLLDSARKLLTDRSFESVTIREICEHAGVANSTFYYHFKTKEELMDGLRAQDDRPLRTELLELVMEPNLTEQLLAVCMMRTARAERHGCSITAQYYKSVIGREDGCDSLDEAHRQEDETVLALVLRAQQAGLISRDKDAQTLTTAAIRLTRCVIFDWCASGGSFDLRAETRRMLMLLFDIKE
ncbi:MAG: TetR/AcrR family transcriptional regulator [Clostridia bacterium]|nr:TetR/AcrR family transcriptional regulator [Clostridia bacterium]